MTLCKTLLESLTRSPSRPKISHSQTFMKILCSGYSPYLHSLSHSPNSTHSLSHLPTSKLGAKLSLLSYPLWNSHDYKSYPCSNNKATGLHILWNCVLNCLLLLKYSLSLQSYWKESSIPHLEEFNFFHSPKCLSFPVNYLINHKIWLIYR